MFQQEKKIEKKKDEEEEEPEEDVEIPPITRIMKLNLPEWPLLLIGSIFAAVAGSFPVAFAIIMSEILEVFVLRFKLDMISLLFLSLYNIGRGQPMIRIDPEIGGKPPLNEVEDHFT